MTSPEQLRREASQTRAELGHTIAQIEQRMSPRRVLAESWPTVAALAAAGGLLAWLLTRRTTVED